MERSQENAYSFIQRMCAAETPAPEVMIVTAHPDDEVIGAGSRFRRLARTVSFVHVTDGSPRKLDDARAAGFCTREEYAAARRRELEAALALSGISPESCFCLGIADQETVFNLPEVTRRLRHLVQKLSPEVVLTLAYEGGHPDHDAVAFAVHRAVGLLERQGNAPSIVEFPCYRAGDAQSTAYLEFLPDVELKETTIRLSESERALKREMISCFRSQARVLAPFPVHFEKFRPAPAYDFTIPPHEGQLYYERFDWGVDGAKWRSLARLALASPE